ncbi:MAG: hypothetical protein D6791_14655 [Chloroflexi bacterium]|nr:MAG: hypothetical protein D6791_14655 [Chloroflexota bacterium]
MKRKLSLAVGLILILLAVSVPALYAQGGGQPTVPWTAYGKVTINGTVADAGTLVEARNPTTNTQCGQGIVITGGDYVINVENAGQTPGCFSDNDTVQFRVMVNGVFQEAQQTPAGMKFLSGSVDNVDLSLSVAPPPPCPDFQDPPGVRLEDVLLVVGHWREKSTDPGWNGTYDLDKDNVISIKDVMMVSARWGDTCPP